MLGLVGDSRGGVPLVKQAIDPVVDEALEAGRVVRAVVLVQDHGELCMRAPLATQTPVACTRRRRGWLGHPPLTPS